MRQFILVVVFFFCFPSVLLAATQVGTQVDAKYTVPANGSLPVWEVSLSKNVIMKYYPGPGGVSFVLTTAHLLGSRVFASGGSITKIYYYNGTSAPVLNPPQAANSMADFTGWNEL